MHRRIPCIHEEPTRNRAGKPASGEAIVFPNRSNGPVSGFPLRTFPYPFSHVPARRARLKTSAAFPRSLRNTPQSDTRGKERPLRHTVRRSEGHNGQGRKPRGGPSDTILRKKRGRPLSSPQPTAVPRPVRPTGFGRSLPAPGISDTYRPPHYRHSAASPAERRPFFRGIVPMAHILSYFSFGAGKFPARRQ